MSANVLIEKREFFLKVGNQIMINNNIENVKKIIFRGEKVKKVMRGIKDNPIRINLPLNKEYSSNDKIYIVSKV